MQDYKTYLEEVQSLQVELKEFYLVDEGYWSDITPVDAPNLDYPKADFLWLAKYDQDVSDYEAILKALQQKAISDVLLGGVETAKLFLNQLNQVEHKFIHLYNQLVEVLRKFREGELTHVDLQQYVYPYFIISKEDENKWGIITQEFINDFEDALMFKSNNVGGTIKQLKGILGIEQTESKEAKFKEVASPTQAMYALYFCYLQETGYEDDFEKHPISKKQAIIEKTKPLNLSPNSFVQHYNKVSGTRRKDRLAPKHYHNIKAVISMLEQYPEAKKLAEDELKIVELKM
ncbi:hypothetical protein [Pontibacter roseus]|uniref:hypothetical protein n=1 Tax=Pontibacter roseus TaxID=336989 RepID=UPI0003706972|nr:hypothetical protein [Pontibacter roseus]